MAWITLETRKRTWKAKLAGTSRFIKLLDKAFLKGMGSSVDLLGFSFEKLNFDLSTGFQRDAEAIWKDFIFVGMDIQNSTEEYKTVSPTIEK